LVRWSGVESRRLAVALRAFLTTLFGPSSELQSRSQLSTDTTDAINPDGGLAWPLASDLDADTGHLAERYPCRSVYLQLGDGMRAFERTHNAYAYDRRVDRLADHIAALLPDHAEVLDVGCGDGMLGRLVGQRRTDVSLTGIDVLVRPETALPVQSFDGSHIPLEDDSVDAVMFVDVLHHTDDPMVLLREAKRVARRAIVVKDHIRSGLLAGSTLRFMDRVGNARHGVALPYNYWTRPQWSEAVDALALRVEDWRTDLRIYPPPADWIFGRSLHFAARFSVPV